MIIEQIRYFVDTERHEEAIEARREVSRVRKSLGLPSGRILLADPDPEAPGLIWQCGYQDEEEMGSVTDALMGNEEYEAARNTLARVVRSAVLELYLAEDADDL